MRVLPVVNSILKIGKKNGAEDLTHLKVQKLLYFLNGWYLATQGKALIDEQFESWPYGPVVPSLYKILKKFGSSPIERLIPEWDEKEGKYRAFVVSNSNENFWDVLQRVWNKYGELSATQLSTLSHRPGSPWAKTSQFQEINDELIKDYFLKLARGIA